MHALRNVIYQAYDYVMLPITFQIWQVFQRRTTCNSCQEASQRVTNAAITEFCNPRTVCYGLKIGLQKAVESEVELVAIGRQMVPFAQQMREGKTKIEQWIAPMDYFMIQ